MNACASCGYDNGAGAKFCIECGTATSATCFSCRAAVTVGQKFCGECGCDLRAATVPAAAAREGERKQVTVLFADLARSMELAERFDPDTWTQIVTGLFEVSAEAVRRYGGTVDKFTGDGLMALFGAPVAQEDHATRAAHAGLALVDAAREYAAKMRLEHAAEFHVRVGLNSGDVVAGDVGDSGFTAVGHTVGLAQRMESRAALDSVCLSEHTERLLGTGFLLRDLGPVEVKGVSAPVRTFALDGVGSLGRRRAGAARLVGRDPEWATLVAALDAAESGRAELIGIVGEAGAGKSRLTEDLARLAEERGMLVRHAVGVSHATNVPLLPIQGLLREYFGVLDSDSPGVLRARVTDRLLAVDPDLDAELPMIFDFLNVADPDRPAPHLGPDARRRRVLDVIRRITQVRSSQVTLLLVLEDLHWFDPASVMFLDEWLPSFPGTRTLVVSNFRPEFRAPWANRSFYRQLPLGALSAAAVTDLVAELIGPDESAVALSADVAARAGGNPFFVEEIVRGWIEDGTLAGGPGAYRLARPVASVTIPSTVQTVLAGRIDRLAPRDKTVLQAASVIGRTFTTTVLAPVVGERGTSLDDPLHALCAAELLQAGGNGEFRFWHPLTQEVAYGSLLNATRRRHHRAVAEALLATAPNRHDELAGLVATHFERAGEALEAGRWHLRAGHAAIRMDFAEANRRFRAAIEHLDAAPPEEEPQTLAVRARTTLLRMGARSGMSESEIDRLAAEARPLAERWGRQDLLAVLTTGVGTAAFARGEFPRGLERWQDARQQSLLIEGPAAREVQLFCTVAIPLFMNYTGPLANAAVINDEYEKLCGGDLMAGFNIAGFSVLDLAYCLRPLFHLGRGELAAARDAIPVALRRFDERPAGEWRAWSLSYFADLAHRTGDPADLVLAEPAAAEAVRVSLDAQNFMGAVRGLNARGLVARLTGNWDSAIAYLSEAQQLAHSGGVHLDDATILAHLAQARLGGGDVGGARDAADRGVETARVQQTPVLGSLANLTRAQIYRCTATSPADGAEARAALDTADDLIAECGSITWTPFVAEERARLDGTELTSVAEAYAAIGATGHAARIRAEIAKP